jgi:hypothetical protein
LSASFSEQPNGIHQLVQKDTCGIKLHRLRKRQSIWKALSLHRPSPHGLGFAEQATSQPWLFKFTRAHTGGGWSEKIASEVAKLLRVPDVEVELAEFLGNRGSASRSFVRTKQRFELIHGSEVLICIWVDRNPAY